ncbi:MAG: hypothetical protein H6732_14840 [Alphaproteobacteria bacterium]|nr:hypothetical protein [Alphaproteobacteria bacterium]
MSAPRPPEGLVDRVVRLVLAVFLGCLAVTEAGTILLAVRWLDVGRVPWWVWAFWGLRTPLFAWATREVGRGGPRTLTALLGIGALLVVLPYTPLGLMDPEDGGRMATGMLLLAGAARLAWSARRRGRDAPPLA